MNKQSLAPLRPMILVFIILNAFFVIFKDLLVKWNADQAVLIIGNLILFVVCLVSFLLLRRSLSASNPHAFVRGVYSGFLVKFLICGAAAAIYVLSVPKVSKPALLICMFLYAVYTTLEVSSLMKLLKKKKNA